MEAGTFTRTWDNRGDISSGKLMGGAFQKTLKNFPRHNFIRLNHPHQRQAYPNSGSTHMPVLVRR